MKILLVVEDISPPIDEGIKKYSYYIARYIFEYYDNVLMYSREYNSEFGNIEILPRNKLLFSISIIVRLKKYKPDIIIYLPHSSSTFLSFVRLKILQIYYRKAKTILISLQKRKHNKAIRKLIKFIKPTKIVIFSKEDEFYYDKINIDCIYTPTGVDVEKFKPLEATEKNYIKKKYGFNERDTVILHVGHINKGRNLEILKNIPEMGCEVLIVGSTSTKVDDEYKKLLGNFGIKIIDYFVENIQEIYQMSDLYVFPVISKTNAIEFPLSILEAMSCNLPIVTTRFGGIVDLFKENNSFQYFTTEDEFKIKMGQLLKENKYNNRETIIDNYAWDKVFSKIFEYV